MDAGAPQGAPWHVRGARAARLPCATCASACPRTGRSCPLHAHAAPPLKWPRRPTHNCGPMATAPGASAAPWLSNSSSSTPPTPAQARDSIELRSPLCDNRIATLNAVPPHTPASAGPPYTPALCTPANAPCSITPPENLRRQSLVVPPSAHMVHLARGSGVSVYRMNRSPREGRARSPWVIKKSEEGILVRRRPVSPTPARSPAHARPSACVCA